MQNFFYIFFSFAKQVEIQFFIFLYHRNSTKNGLFRTVSNFAKKKIIIQILPSETFQYESILLVRVCKIILATFFIFANIFATMNCRHQHIVSSKSRVGNSLFGFSSKSLDFLSERANHKRITHVALF